jgi:hypothetical protein
VIACAVCGAIAVSASSRRTLAIVMTQLPQGGADSNGIIARQNKYCCKPVTVPQMKTIGR